MNRWIELLGTSSLLVVLAVAPLTAQVPAAPPQALSMSAQNLMAGDARHKEFAARGGSLSALLPGDVVRYQLRFTNTTPGPVSGVVFNNPIPAGLRYVGGTAGADRSDVAVAYSIDGGKSFAAQPMVEVEEDGKRVMRPAPADMYTRVRWTVQGKVLPGAQVVAEFRASLPAAAVKRAASDSAR